MPPDAGLDIEKVDLLPGVRRMLAVFGSEAPFDRGRQQIELLAGFEVTAKAVERTAEVIGADIAAGEQREIQRPATEPARRGGSIHPYPLSALATGSPACSGQSAGPSHHGAALLPFQRAV
jgi:hypothetical protein